MRPVIARLILLVFGVLLPGALILVWLSRPPPAPPPAPPAAPGLRLPQVPLPTGSDPSSVAHRHAIQRGERIYQRLCYHCHGRQGLGDNNPYMTSIGHAPADHSDLRDMQKLSDAEFLAAIRDGVKDKRGWLTMPPWSSVLTEREMRDVMAYVRRLPLALSPSQPAPPDIPKRQLPRFTPR
ncbi:MAG: cytochrome c [Candidatus Tectomicrobia bacterium]|nr:cytochrome c [Candidatus Tectomicrobia bacterium]